MRTLMLAIGVAFLAMPAAADQTWMLPSPGVYCPSNGENIYAIIVGEDGILGIDGLSCRSPRLRYGLMTARTCVANGGSEAPYETDLMVLPSGAMLHDSVLYRLRKGPLPCPHS